MKQVAVIFSCGVPPNVIPSFLTKTGTVGEYLIIYQPSLLQLLGVFLYLQASEGKDGRGAEAEPAAGPFGVRVNALTRGRSARPSPVLSRDRGLARCQDPSSVHSAAPPSAARPPSGSQAPQSAGHVGAGVAWGAKLALWGSRWSTTNKLTGGLHFLEAVRKLD